MMAGWGYKSPRPSQMCLAHMQRGPLSLQVNRCLSIKGAEDILNKPHAFEVSTTDDSMFFIADTDKVRLRAHGTCQLVCDHMQHWGFAWA